MSDDYRLTREFYHFAICSKHGARTVLDPAPIRSARLRQTGGPSGVSERRWRFISSGILSLSRRKVASRMQRSANTSCNLLSVSKSISWKRNCRLRTATARQGVRGRKSEVRGESGPLDYGPLTTDFCTVIRD